MVTLRFIIKPGVTNPTLITFNDIPVMREVADAAANALLVSYIDG